jgi:hypothetical protein
MKNTQLQSIKFLQKLENKEVYFTWGILCNLSLTYQTKNKSTLQNILHL